MMRDGLRALISGESDLEVCGEADDALPALEQIEKLKPDLTIVDITLHSTSGLELVKDLRIRAPGVPALVISMHDESLYAERVLRAGGRGDMTATTLTFKADGEKLTGSMTGPQGDLPLQEGKVSGNQISFSTTLDFGGNTIKILYKGTVNGNEIKMTREREGSGQPREFTVKRSGT